MVTVHGDTGRSGIGIAKSVHITGPLDKLVAGVSLSHQATVSLSQ